MTVEMMKQLSTFNKTITIEYESCKDIQLSELNDMVSQLNITIRTLNGIIAR